MASKFRNLIASKVRQTQMMAAGSLEKRPSCSLQGIIDFFEFPTIYFQTNTKIPA